MYVHAHNGLRDSLDHYNFYDNDTHAVVKEILMLNRLLVIRYKENLREEYVSVFCKWFYLRSG